MAKSTIEELKSLVFEQNKATKQNKDKLFRLAKSSEDIDTIRKLANELNFRNAIKFINIIDKKKLEQLFNKMSIEEIENDIANGMNINIKDEAGSTFLHYAAEQDNRKLIQILLKNGANINVQQNDGVTPLLLASQSDNYETMKLLIQNGANVNLKSIHGYTPLMAASAKFNNIDAVNLLLKNNADVNAYDIHKVTPILMASQQNYLSIVKILLEYNADLNVIGKYGYNALHLPCEKGHENIVQLLLSHNIDINIQDNDGDAPLIIASKNGFTNIVKMLLDKNALVDLQNNNGDTAIMRAANGNYFEVVKLLVDSGANLNTISKDGFSVLGFSFSKNNKLMSKYLINAGAKEFPLKGEKLNKMLISAAYSGDEELIQLFIDNGVDKNYKGENGNTPLMTAVAHNHLNVVEILLNNNVNIDLQNDYMSTPLWCASFSKHIDIVKLLLENGANPNIQNGDDKMTALFSIVGQRADVNDSNITSIKNLNPNDITIKIARILLQNEANPNILNIFESTVLHVCSRTGDTEMMKLLLDYNAKMNIQENTGLTALMAASFTNQLEACKILIEYGADVNLISSTQKATAMSFAIEKNNLEIVKLLLKNGARLDYSSYSSTDRNLVVAHPNDMQYGTPLELAKEHGFDEIVDFLEKHLKNIEQIKKNEDFIRGQIKLNHNLSIDVYKTYILFKSTVGNEIFENKYIKKDVNKYLNEQKGAITISNEYIQKISLQDEIIDYKIESYNGDILDVTNAHNPLGLAKLLQKFSDNDNLSYTNHEWDSYTPPYDEFMHNLELGWNKIKDQLKVSLSEKVYEDIQKFLFADNLGEKDDNGDVVSWGNGITVGWSSKIIAEEIKNGIKPHLIDIPNPTNSKIKKFGGAIDIFKSYFVIKNNILKKFTKHRKGNKYKIKLNLDSLKETPIDKIFTDVNRFENALSIILSEMQERYQDEQGNIFKDVVVKVEEKVIEDQSYTELKIIHIGSKSNQSRERLVDTINRSKGFKSIYENLKSVCHWSIDTICSDGKRYKIDYLYPEIEKDKPHWDEITDNIEGFTHILRFYR